MADRSDYRSSGSRSYRGGYSKYRDDRDRGDREDQGKFAGGDKGNSAPPQRQGPKRYQEQRRDWKRRKEDVDDQDKKTETQAAAKDTVREEPKDRRDPKRAERKDSERSDGAKYSDRYKDEPRDRYKDDHRGGSRNNRDGKYGRDSGEDRYVE